LGCDARALYFYELKSKRKDWWRPDSAQTIIEQRDAAKGRKTIRNRHLTLSSTEPSD
jgi:hypothetical protein